jgi:NAD(P)-dependent dehydrogenase (short-subunit alcohol dehydrogenase family)
MAPWIFSVLNDLFQAGRGTNTTFLTDQHVPGADLTGKWIIITGSNNGVGFEAAKSFASWGANLILACREPPAWELHPTAAVNECKDLATANGHSSSIEWWPIDMADLSSVEAFAQKWLQCDRALDILCNNAGIAEPTQQTRITKDGFQAVHQVRFLLSNLIRKQKLINLPDQLLIPCPTNPPPPPISSTQCRATSNLHNLMLPPSRTLRSGPCKWRSRQQRQRLPEQ